MKKELSILIVLALIILSCSPDDHESTVQLNQKIKAKTFEISAPSGWKLVEGEGIDTYIGRIENDRLSILFDQGYLSFGTLANIDETEETTFFQRLEINGVPAIIRKENQPIYAAAHTTLSVYLDNGTKQNMLYVLDSEDDAFFITLFKTHKFLD